jgi:DeoR/GlpR family transcriptional regulator of sugar metabolism
MSVDPRKERTHAKVTLPADRIQLIRERLRKEGRVVAAELALQFGVSEDSVRRDLRELAAEGVCQRVYGGAIAMSPTPHNIAYRSEVNVERKDQLARAAARLVHAGQLVFLDASTTNLAIARHLPQGIGLTVATNSPSIAVALIERTDIEVLLIGGRMDHVVGGTLGVGALQELQQMHPDLCFLGVCSVDPEVGVCSGGAEDSAFKRALVSGCGAIITAVTNEKLGTAAPYFVARLAEISHLVVEADADRGQLDRIRTAGVEIVLAG